MKGANRKKERLETPKRVRRAGGVVFLVYSPAGDIIE